MGEEFTFDTEPVGSVGTLIAAALETAGHSMQSAVLDFFQAGFDTDFAVLLYLLAAMSALFVVGVGGNYKFGLWFFIGPILFSFFLYPRFPSKGVSWKLGGREFDFLYVEKATEGVTEAKRDHRNPGNGGNKVGEVSWFFALWNEFVSEFVTTFVQTLQLQVGKSDLSLLNKVQRYHTLMTVQVENEQLKAFIDLVLVSKCNAYYTRMVALYRPNVRLDSSEELHQKYEEDEVIALGKSTIVTQPDTKAIVEAAKQGLLVKFQINSFTGRESQTPITVKDLQPSYTCEELWKLGVDALKAHSQTLFGAVAAAELPEGISVKEVEDQIRAKVNTKVVHADKREEPLNPDQQLLVFINEMAVRMFFKELTKVEKNLLAHEVDKNVPKPWNNEQNQTAHDIREAHQGMEYESKGIYLSTVLSLPYIQGLTLFVLALSYPFFCMSLIFPGRHWAFLRWMALWFWVKSWDIGFGVVMMLDDLLYNILPHGPPITNTMLENDPAGTFKAILEVDPAYSVQTYYNVLATLITAVPVLTGVLVKRGGSEVVHAVAQGYQNFSGRIGFAMMQYQLSLRNQDHAERVTKNEIIAQRGAFMRSLQDPVVVAALGFELASSVNERLRGPAGNDEFSSAYNDVMKGLVGNAGATQARKIAAARIEQNIARAVYNESQSAQNIRLVHDAIVNYYSNHDWIINHPYNTEANYIKSLVNYQPGGEVNEIVRKNLFPGSGRKKLGEGE